MILDNNLKLNRLRHHYLLNRFLNPDELNALKSISGDDITLFLLSKGEIKKIIYYFSEMVLYQKAKLNLNKNDFLLYRKKISTRLRYYLDAIKFNCIPCYENYEEYGLQLLLLLNRNLAILLSIRLKIILSDSPIIVERKKILYFLTRYISDKKWSVNSEECSGKW